MNKSEKFQMANDVNFLIAIENAQNGKPPLQKKPFQSIGDRMRLITELENQGFSIQKL